MIFIFYFQLLCAFAIMSFLTLKQINFKFVIFTPLLLLLLYDYYNNITIIMIFYTKNNLQKVHVRPYVLF